MLTGAFDCRWVVTKLGWSLVQLVRDPSDALGKSDRG